MQTIVINDVEHYVLHGDPEKAKTQPHAALAVMSVDLVDGVAAVEWIDGEWWSYPDGTTYAPVAAVRVAADAALRALAERTA